jgi:hypothetical protein
MDGTAARPCHRPRIHEVPGIGPFCAEAQATRPARIPERSCPIPSSRARIGQDRDHKRNSAGLPDYNGSPHRRSSHAGTAAN